MKLALAEGMHLDPCLAWQSFKQQDCAICKFSEIVLGMMLNYHRIIF